jgi:3-hydroxyacyl-CoA dehydrogenase/enoyl-CoA hydratase/3-hydroxybutyryl-CoA epimerase
VAYSKAIGKTPVVVKDGPGFLVNRLLMPWLGEAGYALEDGYDILAMDKALKNFGMPMGPFELLDEVGLDVSCKVGHILHKDLGERAKPGTALDKILDKNKETGEQRLGRKTNLGIYKWNPENGRRIAPDYEYISKTIHGGNYAKKAINAEEMIKRQLYPMVNEASRALLEDNLVTGPEMLDLAMIFGTGFPPFRGGLLRWADSVGVKNIVEELNKLEQEHGSRFKPADCLVNLDKFYKD